MLDSTVMAVLLASLPLGFVHALDVDHVVAVSSLAARDDGRRASLRYAALWALGHGGLLMLIALAALLFHWALPPALPFWAERLVGGILIVAGVSMLWTLFRGHSIAAPHAHNFRLRAPLAVGMVHGTAGSAAALALIPMSLYRPELGLAYVLVFSIGVMVGMVGFGLGLGQIQSWLGKHVPGALRAFRTMIGVAAIGLGLSWLQVV